MTTPHPPHPPHPVPSSNPVFKAVLGYGGILAVGIAVVGAVLGGIFAGGPGIAGALVGTAMAVVFLGMTAASILLANRFAGSDLFVGAFFGIVLGSWLVKFVIFIVLVVVLRDQPWLNPAVMFLSIIAGVLGSLVVDVVVVAKKRLPYASDVRLPGDENQPPAAGSDS